MAEIDGPWLRYQQANAATDAAPAAGPWEKYRGASPGVGSGNAAYDSALAAARSVLASAQPPIAAPQSIKDAVDNDEISRGARDFASQGSDALDGVSQAALNLLTGAVRGAGSIGGTLVDAARGLGTAAVQAAPANLRPEEAAQVLNSPRGEQLREGMDAGTRDLGADPQSLTFRAGKLGAEVAGTMGVGGAIAKPALAVAGRLGPAAEALANSIASGGMRTGAAMSPAADMATRIAGGAIQGGSSAALVDPQDTTSGAVIGGLLPPALRVGSAAFDAAAKGVRNVASVVSPNAARAVATEKVANALGDDAGQAIADIQTHYPKGAEDIPLSAAAITKNPALAQMEQGSRLRSPAQWFDFDQQQGRAVFDNVLKATDEANDLGTRLANRQDNWKTTWATASQSLRPRVWMARMTQFGADLETALRSPDSSNPAVRGVLDAINQEMDRVGPAFSPGNLQQLRANLNGKVQPLSPDVFKSAPRDSPAIKSLMSEMDNILSVSTGGKWQKVLEGYAQDSDLVRAAKAAAQVRAAFVDDATGRIRGTALDPSGDIPRITESGLGRAIDAARLPDKSLALSDAANQRLTATQDALRSQNIVQQLKKASTAGGGSDTVPNAIAAAGMHAAAPNMLMQVIGAARRIGTAKTDQQIAGLLANPDELATALEGWLKQSAPSLPGPVATGAARALPVAGAAAFVSPGAGASDTPTAPDATTLPTPAAQPVTPFGAMPIQPTAAPPRQHSSAGSFAPDPVQQISQAASVGDAVQAAFAAIDSTPLPAAAPAAAPVTRAEAPQPAPRAEAGQVAAAPASALLDAPLSGSPGQDQPVSIWTGRRGAGYQSADDAAAAMKTRQKISPDLNWRIEQQQDGAFRLAGYQRADGGSLMTAGQQEPAAETTASGNVRLTGDEQDLRQKLAAGGITNFTRARDGSIVVARSQAERVAQMFSKTPSTKDDELGQLLRATLAQRPQESRA